MARAAAFRRCYLEAVAELVANEQDSVPPLENFFGFMNVCLQSPGLVIPLDDAPQGDDSPNLAALSQEDLTQQEELQAAEARVCELANKVTAMRERARKARTDETVHFEKYLSDTSVLPQPSATTQALLDEMHAQLPTKAVSASLQSVTERIPGQVKSTLEITARTKRVIEALDIKSRKRPRPA